MGFLRQFRSCWAEIDLNAIEHNMKEIRRIVNPNSKIAAIIKADAYGHGSVRVAQSALMSGAEILTVSALDEALELRQAGILAPILILGYSEPIYAPFLVEHEITQTVFNYEAAKAISDAAVTLHKLAKVHIKIDSGMGRIGFLPNEKSYAEIERISQLPNLEIEGIFTHFSSADETDKAYTHMQYHRFREAIDALKARGVEIPIVHCANSAAIIDFPEYHCDMVRAGIIIYGVRPSDEVDYKKINLVPAMSVKARISNIKFLPANEAISYGRKYITTKEQKIATIPIGYADGYSRRLSNKSSVLINGQKAPIIGNICMDQCMVDVTDIQGDIKVGDEVVLFGSQGDKSISVEELAAMLDTIPYEILCDIGRRLPRLYVRNGCVESIVNYIVK